MTAPESPLTGVLLELQDRLMELRDLLREEQTCIGQRDVEALQPLLERKNHLLQDVETLDARRRTTLREAGHEDSRQGMKACLTGFPDTERLNAAWTGILSLLRECQALNESNGSIIHQSMALNERLLNALRGGSADEAAAYGPEGTRAGPRGSRNLGKA
ncbi:MAG: flagellar protein FlgN [Ectothiorhodospiraceae bacterium]|nr:flagellar protein FlgN [Ectothiorhodospiraceae bacterium]